MAYTALLRIGKSPSVGLTIDDPMSHQVDNLVRCFLGREDRSDSGFTFLNNGVVRKVVEHPDNDSPPFETNELVYPRKTDMSLREFGHITERTCSTSSRVNTSDYLEMQMSMAEHDKTVCYYVVYSEVDKRFRDIVIVCINRPTVSYISSL